MDTQQKIKVQIRAGTGGDLLKLPTFPQAIVIQAPLSLRPLTDDELDELHNQLTQAICKCLQIQPNDQTKRVLRSHLRLQIGFAFRQPVPMIDRLNEDEAVRRRVWSFVKPVLAPYLDDAENTVREAATTGEGIGTKPPINASTGEVTLRASRQALESPVQPQRVTTHPRHVPVTKPADPIIYARPPEMHELLRRLLLWLDGIIAFLLSALLILCFVRFGLHGLLLLLLLAIFWFMAVAYWFYLLLEPRMRE